MEQIVKTEAMDPRLLPPLMASFNEFPSLERLGRTTGWLAIISGEVVGSALVRENKDLWHIRRLAVFEKHRGKGIGRKIVEAIENDARIQKIPELTTVTSSNWSSMRGMIQKKGWLFQKARKAKRAEGIEEHWFLPLVKEPIKLILVGANPNGRGGELAECVEKFSSLAKLVGVCDPSIETRTYWNQKGFQTAESLTEILDSGVKANAVMMALPHFCYEECREVCMKNGLAMFHEKPLASTLIELQTLISALGKNPVPLVVGTQRRDHPTYVYLKELIAKETISTFSMSIELGKSATQKNWRNSKAKSGGGALLDLGTHAIDLAHFFLGYSVETVSCCLWIEDEAGNIRPTFEGELETAAQIIGRCGKTWVKIWVNRIGKKSESIHIKGKSNWEANRHSISKDNKIIFSCEEQWDLSLAGRIGRLVTDVTKGISSFEAWDQFSSLRVIEQAYSIPPQIGMGRKAP